MKHFAFSGSRVGMMAAGGVGRRDAASGRATWPQTSGAELTTPFAGQLTFAFTWRIDN
jgi:hypothetical protein